ncbi:unnamed protein product [Didymodactylos carnosus]|uniref:Uncharacterized protein n=1 Tax=Didymodactylos carnosus TaxID=1234261 RepID=A0A814Q7A2_9BILA|nr:unnamed protein product [Didymodactylos carnosus]CAF1115637.1 unnamed protein product [Didymodactylos carnosus]CAF3694421.1 unnamed protein product [Didymodactylos carnosus]CAF3879544.1 unnamed protein product [Didymodactylos carnosus]
MHEKYTQTMPLEEICQDVPKARKLMKLIRDFFSILQMVKRTNSRAFYQRALTIHCDKWGQDFIDLFGYEMVTPYIHVLASHLPEFYGRWMDLNTFSLQGVEKINDLLTQDYFRATNKKGSFFKQMLRKRICQLLLSLPKKTCKDILTEFQSLKLPALTVSHMEEDSDEEDEEVKFFRKNWYRIAEQDEFD